MASYRMCWEEVAATARMSRFSLLETLFLMADDGGVF
jgi:hypothetical protein